LSREFWPGTSDNNLAEFLEVKARAETNVDYFVRIELQKFLNRSGNQFMNNKMELALNIHHYNFQGDKDFRFSGKGNNI